MTGLCGAGDGWNPALCAARRASEQLNYIPGQGSCFSWTVSLTSQDSESYTVRAGEVLCPEKMFNEIFICSQRIASTSETLAAL